MRRTIGELLADPRFWPIRPFAEALFSDLATAETLPGVESWDARICAADLRSPVRFVVQPKSSRAAKARARAYTEAIVLGREVHSRDGSWHDFFNMLVWLAFPRSKYALHKRGLEALAARGPHEIGRGERGDALSIVDEGGVLVLATPSVHGEIAALFDSQNWAALEGFVAVKRARGLIFGHALFEHLIEREGDVFGGAILLEASLENGALDAIETADRALEMRLADTNFPPRMGGGPRLSLQSLKTLSGE